MFFRKNNILYDIIIELFELKIFVPYHQEFIANFMIYLSSFTKQTNSFTNVSIIYLLKMFIFLCTYTLCNKKFIQLKISLDQ